MTETEYAHAVLAGEVAFDEFLAGSFMTSQYHRPYEAPLNRDSRWIHVIKESEDEDMGSAERHPNSLRGQEGA